LALACQQSDELHHRTRRVVELAYLTITGADYRVAGAAIARRRQAGSARSMGSLAAHFQ